MSKILVSGGAGFIGSNLVDALATDNSNEVIIVDNLLTGKETNVSRKANTSFVKADVNIREDMKKIFAEHKFDYVYHYAAVVGVQRTLRNPTMVLRDIEGIRNVLDFAISQKVKRVFFSSSSEVYGEPVEMPQHEETTPLNSRLPYAVVKNVGESFLRSYSQEFGLDYTIFRFFNTYGPRQSADFVMSKFIKAALAGQDITVYGDGSQTRTFCYIKDNIEATTNAINQNWTIDSVVNIGNDKEIKIVDLASKIIELSGSNSKIVHLPPLKEGDMTRRQPDVIKMRQLLKREFTPLEEGIARLIEFQKAKS